MAEKSKKSRKSSKSTTSSSSGGSRDKKKSPNGSRRKNKQVEEEEEVPFTLPDRDASETPAAAAAPAAVAKPPTHPQPPSKPPAPRKKYPTPPSTLTNQSSGRSGYALPKGYKVNEANRCRAPSRDDTMSVASATTTYTQVSTVSKLSIKDEKPVLKQDDPLLMDIMQKIKKAEKSNQKKGYSDQMVADLTQAKPGSEILEAAEKHMPAEAEEEVKVEKEKRGHIVDSTLEFDTFPQQIVEKEPVPATASSTIPEILPDDDFITVEQFEAENGIPTSYLSADKYEAPPKANARKQDRIALYNQDSRKYWKVGMFICCIILAIIVVIVAVVVGGGKKKDGSDKASVEPPPMVEPTISPAPTPTQVGLESRIKDAVESEAVYEVGVYNQEALDILVQYLDGSTGAIPLLDSELTQQYALMSIFLASGGNAWRTQLGWEDLDFSEICTEWWGVECTSDNQVSGLNFEDNNLAGTLAEEIGLLTALTSLDLVDNGLTGSFPTTLGTLSLLREIKVEINSLSGSLAANTFKSMTMLISLELTANNLQGTIPDDSFPASLLELKLGTNQFVGRIPPSLGSLVNLITLELHENAFTGSMDDINLRALTALNILRVSDNQLTGAPSIDLNPKTIGTLHMAENKLEGTLPTEIAQLTLLTSLDLSLNELSGPLPAIYTNLRMLVELDLGGNQLTGTLSQDLIYLTSLETFKVSDNMLEGSIPSNLGGMRSLEDVDLSRNNLTGSVPDKWCDEFNITELVVDDCDVGGVICTCCSDCVNE